MSGKRAIINPNKCDNRPGCPANKACPVKAIENNEGSGWYVGVECTGCGKCIKVCPMKAIQMY